MNQIKITDADVFFAEMKALEVSSEWRKNLQLKIAATQKSRKSSISKITLLLVMAIIVNSTIMLSNIFIKKSGNNQTYQKISQQLLINPSGINE